MDAAPPTGVVGRYPVQFKLFWSGIKLKDGTVHFHLGHTHEDPFLVTAFRMNTFRKNHMVIYNGPKISDGTLATVEQDSWFNRDSNINILSPPAEYPVVERMTGKYHSLTNSSFYFAVMTGTGPDAFPERYEWRQTSGSELKQTSNHSFLTFGWKLVRLGKEAHDSGEEKEVVAVIVDEIRMTSLTTKVAKFQFFNSGATGELGDLWADMAVVTALRMVQFRWFQIAA